MTTGGTVSAGVLAMVLVGAFGGAVAGLIVSSLVSNEAVTALVAAFAAGALALIVGPLILGHEARLSPSSSAGLWNLLIASLIGALAGHELAVDIRSPPVSTLIGAASGVIAAILIAGSLVTVVWARNRPRSG
jgi:hypothetical protein